MEPKNLHWVTLNVGGKYFTTSRSTLVSKEPNSMLARYVESVAFLVDFFIIVHTLNILSDILFLFFF